MTKKNPICFLWLLFILLLVSCSDGDGEWVISAEDGGDDMRRFSRFDDDEFERKAARRQTPAGIPTVKTIETTDGPWVGNNQIGHSIIWSPALGTDRETVIKSGNLGAPKVRTVTLAVKQVTQGGLPPTRTILTGELIVGTGGTSQNILVDWKSGTSISLPMSSVEVVARSLSPEDIYTAGLQFELGAMVGDGARYNRRPTLTYSITNLANLATSTTLTVPPYASRVRLIPIGGGTSDDLLYTINSVYRFVYGPSSGATSFELDSSVVCTSSWELYELITERGLAIVEGARGFNITNVSGGTMTFNVEFELDL